MSSSPTAPTSTTGSSSSWPSEAAPAGSAGATGRAGRAGATVALVACGAIAQPCTDVVAARGWPVAVHPLPPLLHNRPERIAGQVREVATRLRSTYPVVAVGYADCGTYGALDEVCAELGLERLAGLHCYDLYAGPERLAALLDDEPGTYLFTDFLVRSFARTVETELGLDRWPELLDVYFGAYTRVVWLAQQPDEELRSLARSAADRLGLPLVELTTGYAGLELALATLLTRHSPAPPTP